MATQVGGIQFNGRIGNLVFYECDGKSIVRKNGAATAEQIRTEVRFIRTWENAQQFGICARASKQLRDGLHELISNCSSRYMHQRLNSTFSNITGLDTINARGQRKPGLGLLTEAGRELLTSFHFNEQVKIKNHLLLPPYLDCSKSRLLLSGWPLQHLPQPPEASHVMVQAGWVSLDFEKGTNLLALSGQQLFSLDKKTIVVELTPEDPVPEVPCVVAALKLSFWKGNVHELSPMEKSCSMVRVVGVHSAPA